MKIKDTMYPMMAKREVDWIEQYIKEQEVVSVLEWGSGNSTLYFPNRCQSVNRWVALEHNGHYIDYLAGKDLADSVSVLWVPENEWYYQCVERSKQQYDLVIIDGLYRKECLALAQEREIVTKGGAILLHDSGRAEYKNFIKQYGHQKIFDGEKKIGEDDYAHRGLVIFRI